MLRLAGLGAAGVVLLILVAGLLRDPAVSASPLVGSPAPAFRLTSLDGRDVSLEELRGRPVVLNFWASWCVPCREEAPLLDAVAREFGPRGLVVLGVLFSDEPDAARTFAARYGLSYASVIDPDGRTAVDFGVFGIPETFFIDASGTIRSLQIGPVLESDLRARIAGLLAP